MAEKAARAEGPEYRDLMEEKRLVRTDKSLRCILYTHHKYYSLTALRLAGDNTRGHSQITTIQCISYDLIHERPSENVVLNMITRPSQPLASARETVETAYLGLGAVPCPEY